MTKAVLRHHVRLENPTVAELDECFNHFINLVPLKPTEAVLVYYVGHGVEYNQSMHAVLLDEKNERVKYDIEAKANKIAKNRLVHVMFDCNRIHYMN